MEIMYHFIENGEFVELDIPQTTVSARYASCCFLYAHYTKSFFCQKTKITPEKLLEFGDVDWNNIFLIDELDLTEFDFADSKAKKIATIINDFISHHARFAIIEYYD